MSLRIVLRWFAIGAPYSWFGCATRFKDSKYVFNPARLQPLSQLEATATRSPFEQCDPSHTSREQAQSLSPFMARRPKSHSLDAKATPMSVGG